MAHSNDKDNRTEVQPKDVESKEEKLPYPKSVFFIIINEFCERFSFYGMRTVLTLYLSDVLKYSEDTATVIFHVFVMFSYFTPLFGAMLADSLLGKFKTIFYLSIVYAMGNIVLSIGATPPIIGDSTDLAIPISMLGLGLIAIGTGGIKPCVAAFGGDQFILPQQAAQAVTFFSFFYMAINAGGLLSTLVTPILRSDVKCFGDDSCYSLAFAVPAGLMIASIVVFLAGKFLYRENKPTGNVVLKVMKCIGHAISRKRKATTDKGHWLNHADDTYEPRFIEDVKILLRVLVLYIPLPVFWALFDQQGSRWTLQATRMDGKVGGYTIKADQVQVLNGMLILLFIPLFDNVIYPLLSKCGLLKKPLQRLTTGGVLAGLAFIISGVVELELQKTYPTYLEKNQVSLNFVNTLPCGLTLAHGGPEIALGPNKNYVFEPLDEGSFNLYMDEELGGGSKGIRMNFDVECANVFNLTKAIEFNARKSKAEQDAQHAAHAEEAEQGAGFTYLITFNTKNEIELAYGDKSDDRLKPKKGNPKLRFLVGGDYFLLNPDLKKIPQGQLSVHIEGENSNHQFQINRTIREDPNNVGFSSETIEVEPVEHKIKLIYGADDDLEEVALDFGSFEFKLGASYIISISRKEAYDIKDLDPLEDFENAANYVVINNQITEESSMHMLWLVPQYVVITAGEIMFSITGLEFSYSQAPVSMKSVMQSAWLMTVAFGNLIVVIIAESKFFREQYKEFFLFAGLMFVDMILFAIMAYRYIPAKLEDPSKKKDDQDD